MVGNTECSKLSTSESIKSKTIDFLRKHGFDESYIAVCWQAYADIYIESYLEGFKECREELFIEDIRHLSQTLQITPHQVMNGLDIPYDMQKRFMEKL